MRRYSILIDKIINYVEHTPENTNPAVLATLLGDLNKQSDWNQNDATQPDYVKNRPFYTGDPVETVLLEETTAKFTWNRLTSKYEYAFRSPFSLKVGQTYYVSWDGTIYECVGTDFEGRRVFLGNLSIIDEGLDNTGEPFLYLSDPLVSDAQFVTKDASASHTISITTNIAPITKIDEKYIPELPHMDKSNPTGTGSFSLNRKPDTDIGECSFAEGQNTTASSEGSHAEGKGTTASSWASHAEGERTTASGWASHAEGNNTIASGKFSHAEGSITEANAEYSHAEGSGCIVSTVKTTISSSGIESGMGRYGHAEGFRTLVFGEHAAHAEGRETTASGETSHAEGYSTTASGRFSHAEGERTTASGDSSHAEGQGTKASSAHQHVQGKYNVEDSSGTYAHIVGNGTSDTARSNAHTLDWSGNAWYAGIVEGDAFILRSSTASSTKKFKITVDDSGTISATEVK